MKMVYYDIWQTRVVLQHASRLSTQLKIVTSVWSNHPPKATKGSIPINISLKICLCNRWGNSIESILEMGPTDRRHIICLDIP